MELAIYQAFRFDFDLRPRGDVLCGVQILLTLTAAATLALHLSRGDSGFGSRS